MKTIVLCLLLAANTSASILDSTKISNQGALVLRQDVYDVSTKKFVTYASDTFGNKIYGSNTQISDDGRFVFFEADQRCPDGTYEYSTQYLKLFGDWMRPGWYCESESYAYFVKDLVTGSLSPVNANDAGVFDHTKLHSYGVSKDLGSYLFFDRWNEKTDYNVTFKNRDFGTKSEFHKINFGKGSVDFVAGYSDDLNWALVARDGTFHVDLVDLSNGTSFKLFDDWRYVPCADIYLRKPYISVRDGKAALYAISSNGSSGDGKFLTVTYDLATGEQHQQCGSIFGTNQPIEYLSGTDTFTVENGRIKTIRFTDYTEQRIVYDYDGASNTFASALRLKDYASASEIADIKIYSSNLRYGLIEVYDRKETAAEPKRVFLHDFSTKRDVEIPLNVFEK